MPTDTRVKPEYDEVRVNSPNQLSAQAHTHAACAGFLKELYAGSLQGLAQGSEALRLRFSGATFKVSDRRASNTSRLGKLHLGHAHKPTGRSALTGGYWLHIAPYNLFDRQVLRLRPAMDVWDRPEFDGSMWAKQRALLGKPHADTAIMVSGNEDDARSFQDRNNARQSICLGWHSVFDPGNGVRRYPCFRRQLPHSPIESRPSHTELYRLNDLHFAFVSMYRYIVLTSIRPRR